MKFIHALCCFPVLLGGCSLSHQKQTDRDARQFVDDQISIQLQRIVLARKNLQQVSPTEAPQTTQPFSTGDTNKIPSSRLPDKLRGLLAVKSLGTPEPYSVISLDVHHLRLEALLRAIIPPDFTPVISDDLRRKARTTLSLNENDQWPYVLDKLMQRNGWTALIDWSKKQVSVTEQAPGTFSRPLYSGQSHTPARASAVNTSVVAAPPRNPFSDSRQASLVPSGDKTLPGTPAPVTGQKIWRIEPGNTLKDSLFNWAATEKCSTPGVNSWTVAWLTSVNYRVDAPLQFRGDFYTALNALFTLYGGAKVPLYAGIRHAQCVVSVDDKEVH